MSEVTIHAEGIEKGFAPATIRSFLTRQPGRRIPVLNGVDFEVKAGEFVALLGANGAGKTTLLKMIATLIEPDAGSVTVGGHDAIRESRSVREMLGYVLADDRSFHWRLSAAENLRFFARLEGMSSNALDGRIHYLLRRLDLSTFPNRPVGQFSSGMKQRLTIARGLLKSPRILLMDEPTRSIDQSHAAEVWRLVEDELDLTRGSLVLVTHKIEEARALCSRLAILSGGQIVLNADTTELDRYTAGEDGYTITLHNFRSASLAGLASLPGVRDVRITSHIGDEYQLDLLTWNGSQALAAFFSAITDMGATISSFNRATPVQAMLDRILAARSADVA